MNELYFELYDKLARLQWLMQRSHLHSHHAHGPMGDPTRGQGRVLAMLKIQPEISAKDLSYLLGIRQQSLNELLNKLEKNGYIIRVQSQDDKRVMLIRLTEQGKNAQPEQRDFSGIFRCLTETERQAFSEYLDRIIAAMEAEMQDGRDEAAGEWEMRAREKFGDDWMERFRAMPYGRYGENHCRGGRREGRESCRPCHGQEHAEEERFSQCRRREGPENGCRGEGHGGRNGERHGGED